jgi:hypothetical protein
MKSRDDSRKKQDKEISMINGQVEAMRQLSALFFLLPQNGGNRKCQTCLVRSLSAGQFSGDWGMPTNKRSPFCTKGHCLPVVTANGI